MAKITDCEYTVIEKNDISENHNYDNYDIVESKDLVELSELFVIINSKENEEPSVLFMKDNLDKIDEIDELKKNFEKDIPTNSTHSWRCESRIPTQYENVVWISVPKIMLTTEFQKLCSDPNYPKTKAPKDGYINIPEEWIFYRGNPAFITDELFHIFTQKKV